MKKVALVVAFAVFCLPVVASADMIDDAINYVKAQQVKAGIFYDFGDQRLYQTVGATISQDLKFKGLDLGLASDLDKGILATLDYTIKEGTLSPYISAGLGLDRFEKLNNGDVGEFVYGVGAGVKF